jgi:hypothetical protein
MAKKNWRKQVLVDILRARPDGYLVRNKYKVIIGMLKKRYPELGNIEYGRLQEIVFDAVNGNRDWQMLTEGHDLIAKGERMEEWRGEHGYKPDGPTP